VVSIGGRRASAGIGGLGGEHNGPFGTRNLLRGLQEAIEGALGPLDGVRTVVVDIAGRRVSVDFDEALIGHDALVAAIENQGYAVAANG
jgi:copper chaperone